MENKAVENTKREADQKQNTPDYAAPKITSYTNEEILDQIGPKVAAVGPVTPP